MWRSWLDIEYFILFMTAVLESYYCLYYCCYYYYCGLLVDVYCPSGSSHPTPVDIGYYTVGPFPNQDIMTRTSERICEM